MENNELTHWGIKGMRWGVRRYQNKDGTLTPAGRKHYNKEMEKLKTEQKIIKNKQRTAAKFDKLNKMRQDIEDQKAALKGKSSKKGKADENKVDVDEKKDETKELTTEQLRSKVERARLEREFSNLTSKGDSNAELRSRVERARLEKELATLQPEKVSLGKKFIRGLGKGAGGFFGLLGTAAKSITIDVGVPAVKKGLKKLLDLDDDELEALESEAKKAGLRQKIASAEMTVRRNRRDAASEGTATSTTSASTTASSASRTTTSGSGGSSGPSAPSGSSAKKTASAGETKAKSESSKTTKTVDKDTKTRKSGSDFVDAMATASLTLPWIIP